MEISVGEKYVITSNSRCFTLNKRKPVNKKGEYLTPVGDYPTIESLLNQVPQRMLMAESEATTFMELLSDYKELIEGIVEAVKGIKE